MSNFDITNESTLPPNVAQADGVSNAGQEEGHPTAPCLSLLAHVLLALFVKSLALEITKVSKPSLLCVGCSVKLISLQSEISVAVG